MKDLRIEYWYKGLINSKFDKEIEKIAKKFSLEFVGSGFTIDTGIRDLHFRKDDKN